MKLAQLKVNEALVNTFIERLRLETHTFHLECGETIYISRCFCRYFCGWKTFNWHYNYWLIWIVSWIIGCHALHDTIDENSLLLSWLISQFANIHDFTGNQQGRERFANSWILRFIGGVMFVDKSSKMVPMRYLQFLRYLKGCITYAWGTALLDNLYREMCIATYYNVKSRGGFTLLIQLWVRERCPTLAPCLFLHNNKTNHLVYFSLLFWIDY